ncbi:MAG: DUF3187 family protein [Fimbriimonadaceae bacterium]
MQGRLATLIVLTSITAASVAQNQQSPDQILPIQITRGINQTYLRPLPFGPLLAPGTASSDWQLLIQNEFRSYSTIREDGETWRLRYSRRFATEQGEWLVSLPLIHRGGGVLDPFIDWWHQSVVHHFSPGRESTPYGRNRFRLHDGTVVDSGTGFGDLTLGYSFRIPGEPQISLKLPTGNPNLLLGSGGIDLAISAYQTWKLAPRYNFSAQGSLIYQSQSTLWSDTRNWVPTYNLALAYSPKTSQTWILQVTSEGSPVDNKQPYLDQTNRVVSLGLSQATKNGTWTYWISEDGDIGWFNMNRAINVGADFSIGIRYTQKQ